MITTCPCCGSDVDNAMPVVDLNSNRVSYGGLMSRINPRCAEVLYHLISRHPRRVSRDDMLYAVWTEAEYITPNNVGVQIWKARRALEAVKFPGTIIAESRLGYRMIFA